MMATPVPNHKFIMKPQDHQQTWSNRIRLLATSLTAAATGLFLVSGVAVSRAQTSGTWISSAGGNWSATNNWAGGVVADGIGATADFSQLDGSGTVTVDASHNIGNLLFGDLTGVNADNWTLNPSGGSVFNLAVSSGTPTITVNNNSGNNNVATLNVALTGSAGLTTAGTGTLVLGGTNIYTGATTIGSGTLSFPASITGVSAAPAPVLYLSFDKVGGTTVFNEGSGGTAMNGTLVGGAAIVGGGRLGGNALSIPAIVNAGYVMINNPVVSMTGSASWTIGMWMKTSTAGAVYAYQGNGGWASGNMVFHLNNGSADGAGAYAGGVSYGQGWEEGSTVINDGNWHFVVMTCSGLTNETLYVDGNVDAVKVAWAGNTGVGRQLWIGGCGEAADGTAGLNGLIDEVSVYNTALSQAQVQTLMTAGTVAAGNVPLASAVSVSPGATLNLNGNWQTVAGLSGSGTVDTTQAGGSAALTVNNSSATASVFSGVLADTAGSLSLINAGTNSLTLNGAAPSTYTGSTFVNNGTLIEDFANATSPNNLINSSSSLVLGGGTLQVKEQNAITTSQTFAGTMVNPGFSKVLGTQVGAGAVTLGLGAITQIPGGTVDFTNTSTGTITTTTANVNGILGGWATVGDSLGSSTTGDWAANDGNGNVVPYTGYTAVSATASSTQTTGGSTLNWVSGALNGANNITTINGAITINSLVQEGDFSVTAANGTGSTLTLGSGGLILKGESRWMLNNGGGNVIATNYLKSGLATGELYVHVPEADASANNWTIWPVIADGTVPTMLIKDGPGLLKIGNYDTHTGGTFVNGGTLYLLEGGGTGSLRGVVTVNPGANLTMSKVDSGGYNAGACLTAINVNGGVLTNASGGNEGYLYNINLTGGTASSSGGNWVFSSQTTPMYGFNSLASPIVSVVSGPVHFNGLGEFTVAQGTTPSGIDLNITGIINGGTGIYKYGPGALQVSAANTFTGGFLDTAGTIVIANNAGLGTGPLTMSGGTITNLSGTSYALANIVNLASTGIIGVNTGDTLTMSGAITNSGGLTKVGAGKLLLTGVETYTGNTTVSSGRLAVSGSLGGSANINVASGATFDVSGASSFTLGNQSLLGTGTNYGAVSTASGSKIYAGTAGVYGTNTFNGNLTLASGAQCYFALGTVYNGSNGMIVVTGNLTNNNNVIHVTAPSTQVNLDTNTPYVLFTVAGNISGKFASSPVWDVAPANAANFAVVTSGNTVTLQFTSTFAPAVSATASPTTLTRNESTVVSAIVTPGTYPISSVTVNAGSIGAPASVTLVQSNGSSLYTNTVSVSGGTAVGAESLTVTVMDNTGLSGVASVGVTVLAANQVWDGLAGNANWSNDPNWVSGAAPAYAGDSVTFDGTTDLTPNLDNNFSLTGLTFDSTAGSFAVGSTGGYTLTLTGGLTNNSASAEALNVPVVLSGSQTINAAAGNLTLAQNLANGGGLVTVAGSANTVVNAAISGAGGLSKSGSGSLTLAGNNAYTGTTTVNGGLVAITGANALSNSVAVASGTLVFTNAGTYTGNAGATLLVGTTAGQAGALYQSAGTTVNVTNVALGCLSLGSIAGADGYYNLSGGTLSYGGEIDPGGSGGGAGTFGEFDMSGGTVILPNSTSSYFLPNRGAVGESSVVNISGGTVGIIGGGTPADNNINGLSISWAAGAQTNVTTLSGTAQFLTPSLRVKLNQGAGYTASGNATNLTSLNLNGGILQTLGFENGVASVNTNVFINFNGGTLQAGIAANTAFITNLGGVYIYGGGATIHDNGQVITLGQPLLTPAGKGVAAIPVTAGGAGYVMPPQVFINDSTGFGATAYAVVSGGAVTGIVVTSPGNNYTAPTVTLGGGGYTTAAAVGAATVAANVSGGLTKLGSGTLILQPGNTYTGNTVVRGGTLDLNPSSLNTPGNLVASNGTLFLDISSGSTFNAAKLALTNAVLDLAYGALSGNPSFTAVTASGSLSVSGANTINITGSGWVLGEFPLIAYTGTTLPNVSNFKLGALPGITAVLVNNTANHTLDLSITRIGQTLSWYGSVSTSWDFTSANWNNGGSLGDYTDGSAVTFDDSLDNLTENTNISLSVTVQPYTVTLNNNNETYNVIGSGSIGGAATVTMAGSGLAYLGTANTYTGGTFVNAGTLAVTNDAGLGAASGTLTLGGGTLQFVGNTTSTRPLTFTANSSFDVVTNVTAQVAGTVSGTGALTMQDSGTLVLSGPFTDTGAVNVNEGTLTLAGTGNNYPTLLVNGGNLNITGEAASTGLIIVGDGAGANSVLSISGGSLEANTNPGEAYDSSLQDGSGSPGDIQISSGTLVVNRQLAIGTSAYGGFSQSGGTTTIGGFIALGATGNGGVFNQSGGTINMTGSSATIGYGVSTSEAVMTLSGTAVFNANPSGGTYGGGVWPGEVGTGVLNVSGGAQLVIPVDGVTLGKSGGNGTANLLGGTVTANAVSQGTGTGTLNFNGGTLKANLATNSFVKGLTAAYVYSGGATIDDGGFAITIPQTLQAPTGYGVSSIPVSSGGAGYSDAPVVVISGGSGSGATAIATVSGGVVTGFIVTCPGTGYNSDDGLSVSLLSDDGSGASANTPVLAANVAGNLTKQGVGTLTLSGANAYGNAVINAGELYVTSASKAAGSVTVADGAAFGIQISTNVSMPLTSLTLGSSSTGTNILDLAFGTGNSAVPAIMCGTLTVKGTNAIRLAGRFTVGKFPLIQYSGSLAGGGHFSTNVVAPQGVQAVISNSVANSTVYAIIVTTGPGLVWTGNNADLWDISHTTNWLLGAVPTVYQQTVIPGDAVNFFDSGIPVVIVNTNVSPASILVSNNAESYSFTGTGTIGGNSSLTKLGSNSVTLSLTGDSYTGNTTISNGTVILGAANAIGSGTLWLSPTGRLELAGNSQSLNGISGTGIIDDNAGAVTLTTGSGGNGFWSGTISGASGGVAWINNGTNTLVVNGTNYLNGTTPSEVQSGTLIITNGGVVSVASEEFWIAGDASVTGEVMVAGGTLVVSNNWLVVGRDNTLANGTLIVNSGTVQKGGANNIVIGSLGSSGTLIVNGGEVLNSGELWLGENSGANGTLYLNGGLVQAMDLRPNGTTPNTSAAYFNGGTLQAVVSTNNFLQVLCTVESGGLVLDDNGFVLSIPSASLQGDGNGGGVIKKGAGAVYFDADNQYTGTTVVTNGMLAGTGSVNGNVVVGPAGILGAGDAGAAVGTFTINDGGTANSAGNGGDLTLHGNVSLRVDNTGGAGLSDEIVVNSGAITFGGILTVTNITSDGTALTVGQTFQIFSEGGSGRFTYIVGSPGAGLAYQFNPATGVLSIVSGVTPQPGITGISLSGTSLVISGTNGLAGEQYNVLTTTNLALPLADWTVLPTGTFTTGSFSITNTVNATAPRSFYLIRVP